LKPYKAIIFGSQAAGTVTADSDVDLVVVLNVEEMPKSFSERMKNHSKVRKLLRSINREVPMDVLVYTKAEWDKLVQLNSSFAREVLKTGRAIV
jgi:predicted nucleotidyltransferase